MVTHVGPTVVVSEDLEDVGWSAGYSEEEYGKEE
jgi:hypothetical protein